MTDFAEELFVERQGDDKPALGDPVLRRFGFAFALLMLFEGGFALVVGDSEQIAVSSSPARVASRRGTGQRSAAQRT